MHVFIVHENTDTILAKNMIHGMHIVPIVVEYILYYVCAYRPRLSLYIWTLSVICDTFLFPKKREVPKKYAHGESKHLNLITNQYAIPIFLLILNTILFKCSS